MGKADHHYRITDMLGTERPRERLEKLGANALSTHELIGILLGSGFQGVNALQLAQQVLQECGGLPGLQRLSFDGLCQFRGLGKAKAAQLKAAIEIGRRLAIATPENKTTIQSPEDAAGLLLYEMAGLEREHLRVLCLDTRNQLQKVCEVYKGSLNSSWIRIAEVFRDAVRINAAAIIIAHNHPSGDPTPSPEDVAVTKAIAEAGKLLDIEVLDHLVLGQGRYVSMKAKGLGFS